jgi:hypothetical protein
MSLSTMFHLTHGKFDFKMSDLGAKTLFQNQSRRKACVQKNLVEYNRGIGLTDMMYQIRRYFQKTWRLESSYTTDRKTQYLALHL